MTAPATTRAGRLPGRLVRVALVLDFLRGYDLKGRWRSGQQIVEHIKHLTAQIGEQTAYNSSTGAARNCRLLAQRRGLAWWTLDVNLTGTGPGKPGTEGYRLYCVTKRNDEPPHHGAMDAGAVPDGEPPLVKVDESDLERSEAEIERLGDGRAASREVLAPPSRRRPQRDCSSGGAVEREASQQGRLL